jgi:hypothetical protein
MQIKYPMELEDIHIFLSTQANHQHLVHNFKPEKENKWTFT